jgi:formylglycine-generating enzyme required for sulfatase activity
MIPVSGTDFKISNYEINYDAFSRFLNASKLARENRDKQGHKLYSGKIFRYIMHTPEGFVVNRAYKNYPIAYISWYGAKAYVDWYSKVTGKHFALPTASEWTQMAKVGFDRASLFSHANFNSGVLFQCGMKTPNKDGICDIFGNVFEWTATPSGTSKHVIKGGSFRSKKSFLVPQKYGTEYNQNANRSDLGFRIVQHR